MGKFLPALLVGMLLLNYTVSAQVQRISGVVSAFTEGRPLSGAAVSVKGTGIGTVTNQDGFYELEVPDDAGTLVFSHVGMKTYEAPIAENVINAVLVPDVVGLDEVVVVAYGASLRQQYTGSLSTVPAGELERFQVSDFSRALQSLSSGVYTAGRSGQPGEGDNIRIRGLSTFGDAGPLIVLDGFPFDGNLNAIPLTDIQSLTILKDAPATALYGSRAANGVIIVTTKQGSHGPAGLNIQMNYGLSGRTMPDYHKVTVPQYYELQWEGIRNAFLNQGLTAEEAGTRASGQLVPTLGGYNAYDVPDDMLVGRDGKLNPQAKLLWHDNWQDELIKTGKRREIVLNARGGNSRSTYYLSGSALDEDGIIAASRFKRYSMRANVVSQIAQSVTGGLNFSGSLSEQNYPESYGPSLLNPFRFTRFIAPIYPVYLYDENGRMQTNEEGKRLFDFGNEFGRSRPYAPNLNVLGTIRLDERLYKNDVFTARSYLDFNLGRGISFKTSLSADQAHFLGLTHQNMRYGDSRNFNGRTTRESYRTFSYTANQMLRYERSFGEHSLQALAAHENYSYKFNLLAATRSGFSFSDQVELDAAAVAEGSGSFEDNYRLESYFGKIDYAFRSRYFASLNFRTDGNSRFAREVRWGNFWGAGIAWLLSEEEFLSSQSWLSSLKVKASYGEQGNDKIGSYYGYQELYRTGLNNLEYPGSIASRIATPELTWESLNSFNAGVEVVVNERFALNLEYYIRRNNDLLFEKPLPPSTGFTAVDSNVARLSNTGLDMEMKGLLVDARSIKWIMNINLGHLKNEIRELPQEFIVSGNKRWEKGRSIYDFYIEEYAGVNPETGKSQWYVNVPLTDSNNNPVLDDDGNPVFKEERGVTDNHSKADRYYSGSAIPDLFGGINNKLTLHGFELSVLLSFSIGGKVFDHPYQMLMHSGLHGSNFHTDILERWTSDNINAEIPVIDGDQFANQRSSRFLADADYLNVQNAMLSYRIPETLASRLNLEGIRLNLKADNLMMLTARKGLIPGQAFDGYVQPQYVPVRTVSLGFDIHF